MGSTETTAPSTTTTMIDATADALWFVALLALAALLSTCGAT